MFVKSEDRKMRAAIHSVLILCSQKWYQFLSMVCLVSCRFLPGGGGGGVGRWEGGRGRRAGHPWAGVLQAVLELCLSGSLYLSDISSSVTSWRALHPPSLGILTSELWPWGFLPPNPVLFSSWHWLLLAINLLMVCSVSLFLLDCELHGSESQLKL